MDIENIEALKSQTATKVLIVGTIFILGWIVAGFVSRWLSNAASKKFDSHQTMLIKRLSYYVIVALSIVTGLNEAGINLSVVIGAAGVASVAIGFASQTSMSNLISGIFMVIEKPFMVGDTIRVGATTGEVASMGLLSTILKTAENIIIRIPNENLMKSEIANLTRFSTRKFDFAVRVAQTSDLDVVRRALLDAATGLEGVNQDPAPQVVFKEFTDLAIHLGVSVWVDADNLRDVSFNLPSRAKQKLDAAGIRYPAAAKEMRQ